MAGELPVVREHKALFDDRGVLADVEPVGEVADLVDRFEDSLVAVKDRGADLQLLVDPHDRGGGALAADVDSDPDVLAGGELWLADALLPGAGGQPRCLADAPPAGVELGECTVGDRRPLPA